ncbi:uncharacterized protein BJX67DRAFT_386107 [Aspergillus lucknowensis]|uniref:Uncharacterized protein n=1 Tax=Aspergillus lucknowensis TaxID=176173 RepID=A0ABR4L910_9EURO
MNGHQTASEAKSSTRQTRRQRRRQARLELEATDGSSDEALYLGKGQRVPRESIHRVTKLIQFLDSYDSDVDQIEGALGELIAKDEKISNLSKTVQDLQFSNNEQSRKLREETVRLAEQQTRLEEQERSLKSAQQAVEQEKQQARKDKQRFLEEQKAQYEKAVEVERKRLAEHWENRVAEIEKGANSKLQQANKLSQKLEGDIQRLTDENGKNEKTLELYMEHSRQLGAQINDLKSRYSLESIPIARYEADFDKIHNTVKTIVRSYFRELPPENLDVDISQSLRRLDNIFQYIPITTSEVSKFLRVCGAQSVIMKAICRCIWQEFSATTMSISPEVKDVLLLISNTIGQKDRNKEALWRSLTHDGLTPISQKLDRTSECERVLQAFKPILDVLAQLIPHPRQRPFAQELKALLTDCISLWDNAKRDCCIIKFDTEPPNLCGPGWSSESCSEIDSFEGSTKQGRDVSLLAWCLFPRITFKPVSANQATIAGSAIFVDSPALLAGLNELRCQEEEIAQARRNFVRRPSISKSKKTS